MYQLNVTIPMVSTEDHHKMENVIDSIRGYQESITALPAIDIRGVGAHIDWELPGGVSVRNVRLDLDPLFSLNLVTREVTVSVWVDPEFVR